MAAYGVVRSVECWRRSFRPYSHEIANGVAVARLPESELMLRYAKTRNFALQFGSPIAAWVATYSRARKRDEA